MARIREGYNPTGQAPLLKLPLSSARVEGLLLKAPLVSEIITPFTQLCIRQMSRF